MFPTIVCTKFGMNSKVHAVCEAQAGQSLCFWAISKSRPLLFQTLPLANDMLVNIRHDANWSAKLSSSATPNPASPQRQTKKSKSDLMLASTPTSQNREYVRSPQRTTTHLHRLRQMRPRLILSNLHRSNRHILAVINETWAQSALYWSFGVEIAISIESFARQFLARTNWFTGR